MRKTIYSRITNILNGLNVGDSIAKKDILISVWGLNDYYIGRSFDVYLSKYRKANPDKKLKVIKSNIVRHE